MDARRNKSCGLCRTGDMAGMRDETVGWTRVCKYQAAAGDVQPAAGLHKSHGHVWFNWFFVNSVHVCNEL